ncbi:MAG: RNA polymerase sigma factor [Planctomycetota bacterium]
MKGRGESQAEDLTVAAAVRGDSRAMQVLWQTHRRWIAAVLLAHKPRHEDLDDLLQEVAMTLVQKINTLRDHGNVRAWLRAVAINAARAAARSGRYRVQTPLGDHDPTDEDARTDDGASGGDHVRRLMQVVQELPEIYREPLLLRAVQGMRSKQIAAILDIPAATVDTRLARARGMVRTLMADDDERGLEVGTDAASTSQPTRNQHHERLS